MKIAALFEGDRTQIVLTPENDLEKSLLGLLGPDTKQRSVQAYRGGYYHCAGGWTRERGDVDSAIIVIDR